MKRKSDGRLAFTILSVSLLTAMAGAAIALALGVIQDHFSSAPGMLMQPIVSLPALFIIATDLCFSWLCAVVPVALFLPTFRHLSRSESSLPPYIFCRLSSRAKNRSSALSESAKMPILGLS